MESRGQFISQRVQALSNRVAAVISISHITTVPGPVPAPNPPTAINPVVYANASSGANSISIKCQTASGRLVVDDEFSVAGIRGTYAVTAANASSMDLFSNVTFNPGLSANVTAGTKITFNFVNQQKINAYLSGSTKSIFENGTITVVLEILVPALNLNFVPNVGDRVSMNGTNYLIGSSVPVYAHGVVASYRLMVK